MFNQYSANHFFLLEPTPLLLEHASIDVSGMLNVKWLTTDMKFSLIWVYL